MLTNAQIDKIVKSESHTIASFFKTINYIYKSKSSEKIKNILSRNISKNPSAIKSLIWELIKYFVISYELINIRKELFNMMFNKYAKSFEECEIVRIINNPSNQWLDYSHKKIELLSFFLDELISNPQVCEKVCDITGYSRDEYYNLRNHVINQLDSMKFSAFENFEKTEIQKLDSKKKQLISNYLPLSEEEAHTRQKLYKDNFEDSSLLDTEE